MNKMPRPSTLYYLSLCPGYRNRPDEEDDKNSFAERGTTLHKAVEEDDPELAENEFDRNQVLRAIEFRKKILDAAPKNGEQMSFTELRLTSEVFPKGGSLDHLLLSYGDEGVEVDIIDYKFGFKPVDPPRENAQVLSYVSMTFETLPEVKKVRAHVVFPGLGIFASDTFVPSDLPKIYSFIRGVAESAESARVRDYRPGNACAYCALASRCPKILEDAGPTLSDVVSVALKSPESAVPNSIESLFSRPPMEMEDNDLGKARTVAKATIELMEAAVSEIDKEIKERGVGLFGYRIQKRSGSVTVDDFEGLLSHLIEEIPDVFSNEKPEGVSNLLRVLSDTSPTVPITRFIPALHGVLESQPSESLPLRFQGLSKKELRETLFAELLAKTGILKTGSDTTFVVKKPKMGYEAIFKGFVEGEEEDVQLIEAANEEL